jgi:tetratricopeptide (TPR) repeat protein
MPARINGIGTGYYGKRNHARAFGTCEHCKRGSELSSYETREFFCIVFIPIIPLRRFQILNYCSLCTRHRRMPFAEFGALRDREIQAARAALAKAPNDPEAAEALCQTLVAYHRNEQAIEAYRLVLRSHPERPSARQGLARALARTGRKQEALDAYREAITCAPEREEAILECSDLLIACRRRRDALEILREHEATHASSTRYVAKFGDRAANLKDYPTAARLYARLIELRPGVANDAKFVKLTKKMHRKAGLTYAPPGVMSG